MFLLFSIRSAAWWPNAIRTEWRGAQYTRRHRRGLIKAIGLVERFLLTHLGPDWCSDAFPEVTQSAWNRAALTREHNALLCGLNQSLMNLCQPRKTKKGEHTHGGTCTTWVNKAAHGASSPLLILSLSRNLRHGIVCYAFGGTARSGVFFQMTEPSMLASSCLVVYFTKVTENKGETLSRSTPKYSTKNFVEWSLLAWC